MLTFYQISQARKVDKIGSISDLLNPIYLEGTTYLVAKGRPVRVKFQRGEARISNIFDKKAIDKKSV